MKDRRVSTSRKSPPSDPEDTHCPISADMPLIPLTTSHISPILNPLPINHINSYQKAKVKGENGMHRKNYLLMAMLLLLVSFIVACGGGGSSGGGSGNATDYSRYSGTWNINTIQTGSSYATVTCEIGSPVPATVSPAGDAFFGPIGNECGTVMRGTFSANNLTLTSSNDRWHNNGIICCTGTFTITMTFSDENNGTGSVILNNCPGQEDLWCTLDITMTK